MFCTEKNPKRMRCFARTLTPCFLVELKKFASNSSGQQPRGLPGLFTPLVETAVEAKAHLQGGTMRSHFLISCQKMPIINEFANEFLRLENSQCWEEAKQAGKKTPEAHNPP